MMILIVDDFVLGAHGLAQMLRLDGYPSEPAKGGLNALEMIRKHIPPAPLLVVLDYNMAEMNGMDVLRAIRADPVIGQSSVVFHGAYSNLEIKAEAERLAVTSWLPKNGGDQGLPYLAAELVRLYRLAGGKISDLNALPSGDIPAQN